MKTPAKRFPEKGAGKEEILQQMKEMREMDSAWENGHMFGFVYYPGKETAEFLEKVYTMYLHDNALNPTAFISLRNMENVLTAMLGDLFHGDKNTCGSVTSGGTESILMAMKVARDRKRENMPGITPEVLAPVSVHPAFDKAAHYLGIKLVHVPLKNDFRVDVKMMASLINERTAMLVGSAPCFPYGVVDPVEKIAGLAQKNDLLCHVDACMGGFMLPFIEKLGNPITPFDFRCKGVTSISADVHKNGYSFKGASVVLYRDPELRKKQFFITTEWPGGIFASSSLLGSKSGGPAATAWAMVKYMGSEGYIKMASQVMETTRKIQAGILKTGGFEIAGNPEMSVFAVRSDKYNVYEVGDELSRMGWLCDRLQNPECIHFTVTMMQVGKEEEFLDDFNEAVLKVREKRQHSSSYKTTALVVSLLSKILPERYFGAIMNHASRSVDAGKDSSGSAALYGISSKMKNRKNMREIVLSIYDKMYRQG